MNKLKIILLFLTLTFMSQSCEDSIDITQPGVVPLDEAFQSISDMQSYLNGIYPSLSNTTEIQFTSVFTDELSPSPGYNGSNRDLHRFVLDATSGFASSIWIGNYSTINDANRLINGALSIEPSDEDLAEYNSILAQTRTIRAMAYLNLLSYFSTDMTDDNALGVMLYTEVPEIDLQLPRSSNADCFAQIIEDLMWAKDHISTSNSYLFINKTAIHALLARTYAYRGMYADAANYANMVVNNSGLQLSPANPFNLDDFYTESPSNPYRQIWSDAQDESGYAVQNENILSLQSLASGVGFSPASLYYFNTTQLDGQPIWGMGLRLYQELVETPEDVRSYAFVDPSSQPEQNVIMIDKYPGIPNSSLKNNIKLIRLSEMYFILAEAATANNDLVGAANYLNVIQQTRLISGSVAPMSFGSATEAWGAILDERRKELCFEGHRYIDLKRLGQLGGRSIDRSDFDDELSGF